MAAVTIPAGHLPDYVAIRPTCATYRRRRLVVLLIAVVVACALAMAATRAVAAFRASPASRPEHRPAPRASLVVQPGDTLWSIARAVQPHGEVRPLVDALIDANGGSAALAVGQVVEVP
jgi:Tfp pilus assembly protein FimV